VAHEAAERGFLPKDIEPNVLEYADNYGQTVAQILAKNRLREGGDEL
jgi:hypothetical protein